MLLNLPSEVVDVLVGHVEDRQTLASCSLTCRRWLPASRFHLFRSISLPDRAAYDLLVRIRDASHMSHSFDNLYSLQLCEDQEKPWLHLVPLTIAHCLSHVRILTLLKFQWDEFPLHPSFYSVGYVFTSLTSLTLVRGTFMNFAEFRRLVCAFDHLSELIVERVWWRNSPLSSPCGYLSRLPLLRLLWVNSGCEGVMTALADWLLQTPSEHTIQDLQLGDYGVQSVFDQPAIQRLTRALGSSLESYDLSLKAWTKGEGIDLSPNTSLRALHVRNVDAGSLGYLVLLLERNIFPMKLARLSLDLWINAQDVLESLTSLWAMVDEILAGDGFSSLETVTVWLREIPRGSSLQSLLCSVERRMPRLRSRSLLQVKPWWNLAFQLHPPSPGSLASL